MFFPAIELALETGIWTIKTTYRLGHWLIYGSPKPEVPPEIAELKQQTMEMKILAEEEIKEMRALQTTLKALIAQTAAQNVHPDIGEFIVSSTASGEAAVADAAKEVDAAGVIKS